MEKTFVELLKELDKAYEERRVNPHAFRHARATDYAGKLTEQQLKMFMGWTPNSNMCSVYVHISGKSLDSAIMYANGKASPDRQEIKPMDQSCPRCRQLNTIDSSYCSRCACSLEISVAVTQDAKTKQLADLVLKMVSDKEFMEDSIKRYKKKFEDNA